MKLITTIYLGIGCILVMICLVTCGYLVQTQKVKGDVAEVQFASEVTKEEETAQKMIINMETGFRGYLLTGKQTFLEPYYDGRVHFLETIERLGSLTQSSPIQNKLVHEIEEDALHWIHDFAEPLRILKSREHLSSTQKKAYQARFEKEVVSGRGKAIMDRIRKRFSVIAKEQELIKEARVIELGTELFDTNIIAVLLTVVAIITGVLTASVLASNLRSRIKEMNALAQNVADGEYDVSIIDTKEDEISGLIKSLNAMARQLQASFSHLTKMNQELDQFAYVVSHDLKAPLRAINNLAEWIAEDLPREDPEIQHNLTLMRGRVQRMENLINGILEYSKIGRKEMPKSRFSTEELLQEIIDNLAPPATFQIIMPRVMPVIYGERTLLYQVLANLLSNAVKYHHLSAGTIAIRIEEEPEFLRFEVEDDGPGIPKEFHQKVFGLFQTMEARDVKESTGIGLAIVKKIVEEKGGQVWIESNPKQGSTFIFTWPNPSTTQELQSFTKL